ncbi:hypothetical protein [uncultured Enterovirga sp.]|uniref:hypothetical protein n=1 Tax=uncultured Enterovirga sp. TaxID=2026352 RepID=UPI0035C98E67
MTLRPGSAPRGSSLVVLIACVMALGLGACGRRGQPEAPVDPAAPAGAPRRQAAATGPAGNDARPNSGRLVTSPGSATQLTVEDDTEEEDPNAGVSPQPVPTASRRRSRAYQVPKEPFILDPLL